MDLGVVGLLTYVAFFALSIARGLRGGGEMQFAVAATVVTLLVYFTVEAAFRQIQMNFLLGSLCAVLAKGERA